MVFLATEIARVAITILITIKLQLWNKFFQLASGE